VATQRGGGGSGAAVGLAAMSPPAGALVAFSTEPGHVAADGIDGHGLYTKHLAHWLKEPNLTLEQVFKRTREAVKTDSGDTQIPTEYSLLTGADFYLTRTTMRLADTTEAKSKKNLGLMREATSDDMQSGPSNRSVQQARRDLASYGAKFNRADFLQAIDDDDVLILSAFIDSKFQFGTDVIWRSLGISNSDLRPFPQKSMQYFVDNFDATGLSKKDLCSGKADIDALDQLKNGARSLSENYRAIFSDSDIAGMVKIRREYYFKFCGVDLSKPTIKASPKTKLTNQQNLTGLISAMKKSYQQEVDYYKSPEAKKNAELFLQEFQKAQGQAKQP